MLRFSLAAMAAFLTITPAMAQAYPEPYGAYWQRGGEEPWYGYYVGINGGGTFGEFGSGNTRFRDPPFVGGTSFRGSFSEDADGGTIGGTIGSQLQAGGFVFGVEADLGYADAGQGHTSSLTDPFANSPGSTLDYDADFELKYLGTVRLRAGYAINRLLLFATGGYAFGEIETSATARYTTAGGTVTGRMSDQKFHSGYSVGGGAEFMLTPHITAKAEYLFADLGQDTYSTGVAGVGVVSTDVEFQTSIVRAGLNYKF